MKVSELSGIELDLWVARAVLGDKEPAIGAWVLLDQRVFKPSTRWDDGGPIIEREKISILHNLHWYAAIEPEVSDDFSWLDWARGQSALEASMRCFVASKFGPEVKDV